MKKRKKKAFTPEAPVLSQEASEALEIVTEIADINEEIDDWRKEKADDPNFFDNLVERAESIGDTIREQNRVSDAQLKALTNMRDALKKWLPKDKRD